MPKTVEVHDDESVTFTLPDGSRINAAVDSEGLAVFAEQEANAGVILSYVESCGNVGWLTTTRKPPVRPTPIRRKTR